MSSARRAAMLPLAVAVGGVLLAATPAFATVRATWSKPTDNSTFTTPATVDFAVTLDRGTSTLTSSADGAAVSLNLAIPGPNPGPYKVDTSSGTSDRDLKFTFDPACPNHAGACAAGSPTAYNGRYTASLSGATTGSRTVMLQIPPAAPTGVSAIATGQRRIKVSWNANREPDLTGYDVFNADGVSVASNLPADRTSHEFELPSSGYGGEHTYVVRAHRLACANCPGPDSGAQLSSPMSSPASVTLNEPTPQPDPDEEPGTDPGTDPGDGGYNGEDEPGNGSTGGGGSNGGSGGGSGGGSTGGSGGGGNSADTDGDGYNDNSTGGSFSSGKTAQEQTRAAQQRLAFGLTFKSFAPKLGAPKLPPLPKFAPPAPETIPWGTYDPTLDYGGDKNVTGTDTIAEGGGFRDTVYDSFSMVFEGRRLFRSIAIALLLFLAAAHLRLWLRSTPTP
ncbi:MAG TPA: hypothetical protein VNQ77_10840 [Frankiaceae bacterium]|nr:hypothetical protein [Frankiaceae bacterium]